MPHAVSDNGKKTFPSLSTSLGVKGSLRVRPYGNVKHAHIVLRKVDEEDYVDSKGITRRRAIFSLFAQKLINVKPGKELYLYLHPTNSDVKDTPIAFEADLTGPDEEPEPRDEEDNKAQVQESKKDVKEPEVREQAMPPKMRKAWLRKQESALPNQVASPPPPPTTTIKPVLSKVSVGTQTLCETTSVYVQTIPQASISSSTQTISKVYRHLGIQTADKAIRKRQVALVQSPNVTRTQPERRARFAKDVIDRSQSIELSSETGDVDDFKSRSLSPMELESPATTPSASPHVDEGKAPPPTNEIRNSRSLSPLYSPRSYSPIIISEIDNTLAQVPVDSLKTVSTSVQAPQTNREIDNSSTSTTQTLLKGVDSPSASKTKTIPFSGEFESAYNEIHVLLNKQDTKELKGNAATKRPLPGFVKATVPYSQATPEPVASVPTPIPELSQSGSKADQATITPKSRGFISSFVPISSDSFTARSRVNITKRPERPEPPQKTQSDITPTSSNGHFVNTPQYSPLSPSINAIASSSKVTVERFVRHSSFNNPPHPPTTVPMMRPPPPPISAPIMSFLPPSSTPIIHPPSTPILSHPLASVSPQTPIPIPVSYASPSRSVSSSHILGPQSSQSTPLRNGNSRAPSEIAANVESSNTIKVKEEVLSPTLLPLSLPEDFNYDPGSSFDASLPENGFDMLPVSVVHASDPNYVQDDVEYGPPRPMAQPQYDSNGIKAEPIDIPLLFNDFNFSGFPKNTNDYTNLKSDPYNYSSPAHASLPPKPYFTPQNEVPTKRRRVESVDSDDDNSNRRNMFRRVYTSQIRFDFGAGIREVLFNHTGSHFAVICYDHTIRIWNNRAKIEIAKLAHNASVITASWSREVMGVISLGMNGVVNRWTCSAQNQWHWSQLLDTGDVEPTAMDYRSDRVAVAFPRVGVRLWVLIDGYWQQQRIIRTAHVLAVKFIGRGDTLLSACADGRLWRGYVRDGVKEVCHVTRTKIFGLDVDPSGRNAVVTEAGGKAHVLTISPQGQKFTVNNMFGTKDIESRRRRVIHPFGALLASHNNLVVFGSVGDRIFVWDRSENSMISELDHGDNILVQAVASLDEDGGISCLLTGNKEGRLVWWTAPANLFDNIMAEPLWKRPRVDY